MVRLRVSGGKLTIRKFAAVAIGASILISTTGCNFMSPIASKIDYAPADGSQTDLANLKVRNFVYLTNGTKSVLTGSIINPSLEPRVLKIVYTDSVVAETKTVTLPVTPGGRIDLGYNGGKALEINLGGKVGGIVRLAVVEGSDAPVQMNVPVLDGTFDFYKSTVDSLDPGKSSGEESPEAKTEPEPAPAQGEAAH